MLALDLLDVPLRHLEMAFSGVKGPRSGQSLLEGAFPCWQWAVLTILFG
jgi:hypothetical protein